MRKIIAVDVDLTVVDTLSTWIDWYESSTGHSITEDLEKFESNYNVDKLMNLHNSPLDYWKTNDLYDNLKPIKEASQYLSLLKEHYDIIFISSCFPEHTKSKENFLRNHFPYLKAFIATSEKGYVRCDYVIDDYVKYLDQFNDSVKKFLIGTKLNIKSNIKRYSWEEIYQNIIEEIENEN